MSLFALFVLALGIHELFAEGFVVRGFRRLLDDNLLVVI